VIDNYHAGTTPGTLAAMMMEFAESRGAGDFILPGCEHGIGLFGDEWRVGAIVNPDLPTGLIRTTFIRKTKCRLRDAVCGARREYRVPL